MQIQEEGLDISYMEYNQEMADNSFMAVMHNMADFQYLGSWSRCWFDLGTSDAIAIDILINSLRQINREYVPIKKIIIGGENEDWKVEESEKPSLIYDAVDN